MPPSPVRNPTAHSAAEPPYQLRSVIAAIASGVVGDR